MGFFEAVETCLKKYAVFQGRARRSEYWWFGLFQLIIYIGFTLFTLPDEMQRMASFKATGVMPPQGAAHMILGLVFDLIILALVLPNIGVLVRRLHDVNRSGWWYFFCLVPLVGPIMLLIWFCTRGTRGTNRFGPDPIREF